MSSTMTSAADATEPRPTSAAQAPAALDFAAPSTWNFSGRWTALGIGPLARQLAGARQPRADGATGRPVLDGSRVESLDSVGAMLIGRWLASLGIEPAAAVDRVEWRGWQPAHRRLLERVAQQAPARPAVPPPLPPLLERVGRAAWAAGVEGLALLSLVGECAFTAARDLVHPSRMRWRPLLHHVQVAGLGALPIVGLLSVLMGIVVTYQGADQLARYGANIFVVDLVAISMLREFAPLVTAIIIAGRSGAAFAAQLGTMAVTEEIDALRVLGIAPTELLVLPRMFALFIALPLLTVFADVTGVFGGMVMARSKLGVDYAEFFDRLPRAIDMSTLLVGLFKAPVFAAIIAVVGCFQGLRTSGGADSVGTHTTRAVVQSIFFIIVADALFSVVFNVLGI
ncbi:MAG TPA: ABC transporter permease [Burkholderiaceae bacterium]|jgi:phospholipid/cholesterol/gamma-HCH transport system permease protein|nr:ABC transporter permease [Burkholderiaceae bacterium]